MFFKKKSSKMAQYTMISSKSKWGILFIAPFFLIFCVFWLYPFLYGIYLGFFKWGGTGKPVFIGIENFKDLFADTGFRYAIGNSFYWAAGSILFIIGLATFLAIFTNSKYLKAKGVFRTIIFAPVQISLIVESIVFLIILDHNYGILRYFFDLIHVPFPDLLNSRVLIMPTMIAIALWRWTGFNMMFLIAQLVSIPKVLNEAAQIDGANSAGILRYVTLPLLKPMIFYVSITSLIASFQVFEEPFILTQGGPRYASTTTGLFIYMKAFASYRVGYASAAAVIVLILVLVITIIAFKYFGIFRDEKKY